MISTYLPGRRGESLGAVGQARIGLGLGLVNGDEAGESASGARAGMHLGN